MSKLLGVLPVRFISSLVPESIHHSLNIDFGWCGQNMPDRFCRVRKMPGNFCLVRQNLPSSSANNSTFRKTAFKKTR
jgi:hypothetical protein